MFGSAANNAGGVAYSGFPPSNGLTGIYMHPNPTGFN